MTGLPPLPLRHTGKLGGALGLARIPRGGSGSSSFYGQEGSLSPTGASGLARLLFLRNRNVHHVLPQTHTLPPPPIVTVYRAGAPGPAPRVYSSHSQPTISN